VSTAHIAKPSFWRYLFGAPHSPEPQPADGIKDNRATRRVLVVLMTGAVNLWDYPISRLSGIGAGSVYVVLARLELAGWVESAWEESPPAHLKGHRRRFYPLTPRGRYRAERLLRLEMPTTEAGQ
jgi:PadR family transcriptional regulator, regulatory protein PadR